MAAVARTPIARSTRTRTRAPRRRRRLGPLPAVLGVEIALLLTAVLVAGWLSGGSWLRLVLAVLLLLLAVLAVVPVGGRPLWRVLRGRLAFAGRHRRQVRGVDHALVPLAQWLPALEISSTLTGRGVEVGVVHDGSAWTAVLGVSSDQDLLATGGSELNLLSHQGLCVHDDVVLAGVQTLTWLVPAPTTLLLGEDAAAVPAYRELAPELPPAARMTWVAVRLDPQLCLPAVERRGRETEGVVATLRFALHRVQSELKRQGVVTEPLDAAELAEVLALTTGSGPDQVSGRTAEQWQQWSCDALVHTGRLVPSWGTNPSRAWTALVSKLTTMPVLCALAAHVVTPDGRSQGAVRLVTADEAGGRRAMAELARVPLRFGPGGGAQVPVMLATVPLGRTAEVLS